ncbi:hypothetical protein DDZ14_02340 [Maritimibacter sp. 55A14]|nr:hypothetical protein DDZ14_02340 [Maritimibacter sp. 55A14]
MRPVSGRADRRAFLDLPYRAYGGMDAWRPPLRFERAAQIDPKRNPALARMEHELMLAWRGGEVVGRIAALVNPAHLDRHGDATGHFGFLDTLGPDSEAVAALTEAAGAWLGARGMERIAGPFNFSVNEECGLLVDGFDTPPVMMMPHGRPDYAPTLEALGFAKQMDMYAYMCRFADSYHVPPAVQRMKDGFLRDPALEIRPLDMKNYRGEIETVLDIFNDAWSQNWGFVPFTADQIGHLAQELKPLVRADALWIAMIEGEAAGFTLILPDLNEVIDGLDGHLLPFGWAQLIWGLKVRGTRRGRLPLAGLRRRYHKTRRGMLAMTGSCEAAFAAAHARGMREIEASWILETNRDLLNLVNLYEAPRYKTYRIYGKAL